MELIPFARQARRACPGHAELALALAAEFRPPRPGADRAFDHLAAPLVGCEGDPPGEQLAWCAEVVAAAPGDAPRSAGRASTTCCSTAWSSAGPAIRSRSRSSASRRRAARASSSASWPAARAASSAIPRLDEPLLLDVARGRLVEAGGRPDDAGWQCAHQVAARILNRIGERADATGNVAWALRAAELRLALPFARPVRDELVHALAHLRARLN